jgi:DNA helicase-2/ATP-dependent DNA helicase PcrA
MLVGAHVPLVREDEEEAEKSGEFFSPFKQYYFSKERFTHDRSRYLQFLSGLRVFVQTIREYRQGEVLKLHDLVEFVDLYENNNLKLNDVSPFSSAGSAVHLMTAHKAKGLEFDTVFVLSCQQSVWAGRGMSDKISFPANLPIRPASDTLDDKLRLFYVALTRAKRHLYLTGYTYDEKGKESTRLEFLVDNDLPLPEMQKGEKNDVPDTHDVLTSSWLQFHAPEFSGDEEVLLKSLLDGYQMSVTHLNNFLDLVHGGPQKFLENNLLRFPKAKSSFMSYGTSVHKTIELVYLHLKNKKELPSVDEALGWFETELYKQRLSTQEFELELARGKDELKVFLEQKIQGFEPDHLVEVDFKHQGVVVGDAHLAGKIDKIITTPDGTAEVHDYKTGRIYDSWEKGDPQKKVRLRELERQLMFYRLLMNESRDYAKYDVAKGVLEFVRPRGGELVELAGELTDEKVEHLRALIQAVHTKIMSVDFPDVSGYSKDIKGVEEFEKDLIEGKI